MGRVGGVGRSSYSGRICPKLVFISRPAIFKRALMMKGLGLYTLGFFLLLMGGCNQWNARISANSGHKAYLEKKFDEAIASYEEAREELPKNQTILRNLGYSYLAASREDIPKEQVRQKSSKAIDILTILLAQDPNNTELASLLLDAWEQADRLTDAAQFFKTRLEKNPNDLQSLKGLGIVELKRGNYRDALTIYEKRKTLEADDKQIYILIAQTCWQWLRAGGPNDLQEAVQLATRGIDAALEGSKRDPLDTTPVVFARLLLFQRVAMQKDKPIENASDLKLIESLNKKIEELNKKAEALSKQENASKAGKDEKR